MNEFVPYPDWYRLWMDFHLGLFCIDETPISAAFMRWWPAFESMRVTPKEMKEATNLFHQERNSPARIAEHFDRLCAQLADIRTKRDNLLAIKRELDVDKIGVCTDCGDSGYVAVPHPANIAKREDGTQFWKEHHYGEAGNPIYYRASVVCTCPKGRKVKDWQERVDVPKKGKAKPVEKKRALLLEDYQAKVFDGWRHELADVERRLKTIRDTKSVNDYDQTTAKGKALAVIDPRKIAADLANRMDVPPPPAPKKGRKK